MESIRHRSVIQARTAAQPGTEGTVMPADGGSLLRVAAYCRVSTDKEDQRNSLSVQQAFFLSYVQARPAWRLVGVFADQGLSGTSVRRPQFARMIQCAMDGQIDLILTKEVSRFARNTVDTLQITRRLKERGVGVCFLNDNLDTRDNDGEFRLTIMASVAQEESRKISERTRWGQLQAMKRGVVFGNNSLYGYTLRRGVLTVQPEQAAVVRLIYHKFLAERKGSHIIARELTQDGVPPPLRPDGAWSSTMILRILRNEKYCGDLLQKKYRTTDHLTHRKIPNDGTEEQLRLPDHHEAIVSRQDFQQAQAELERRAGLPADGVRFSGRHWYSGKVRCGDCGKTFALKRTRRSDGAEYTRFVCRGRLEGACRMRAVRGELVHAAARHALQQAGLDVPSILRQVLLEWDALGREAPGAAGERQRLSLAARRQAARKSRTVNAYLDGALSLEDMRRLLSQCDQELTRLHAALGQLEAEREASGRAERGCGGIRPWLEAELQGGDAVLDEAIRQITICRDHVRVELNELPVPFLLRTRETGAGRSYSVEVTACVPFLREDDS